MECEEEEEVEEEEEQEEHFHQPLLGVVMRGHETGRLFVFQYKLQQNNLEYYSDQDIKSTTNE